MALPEDNGPPLGTLIKLPKCTELESMGPQQATFKTGGSVRLEDSEGRQLLSDLDDGTVYYPQGDGLLEEPTTAGDCLNRVIDAANLVPISSAL